MNSPYPFLCVATEPRPLRVRDITWDRVLFQPPALLNPRQIFEPLPFRMQNQPPRLRSRAPFAR